MQDIEQRLLLVLNGFICRIVQRFWKRRFLPLENKVPWWCRNGCWMQIDYVAKHIKQMLENQGMLLFHWLHNRL
jgi:hypothetical protein